jgi:hypothetical protein
MYPMDFKSEVTMRTILIISCLAIAGFLAAPDQALGQTKPIRVIVGTISDYECGDNCYLTIVDSKGKKHHGLCAAAVCNAWNDVTSMPRRFIGMKVRATVGKRNRYDGGGDVVDRYDAFTTILFLTTTKRRS